MFDKSASVYDAIYSWKDYAGESDRLHGLIQERVQRTVRTLLDVGCGTGMHLAHLRQHYVVEGLDLDPGLLEVAHVRLPGVPLHEGNMLDFDLGRTFDVVTCLFSAIAYMGTPDNLNVAVANMARHVAPGGLLIVEPWLTPEEFVFDGKPRAHFADLPDVKVARISMTEQDGNVSVLNFHYLAGASEGVSYFTEQHRLTLFTHEEYMEPFRNAGLEVTHDPLGLMGRGLYVGVKSPTV